MKKCGYATIIGKTNVGKSTFLNNFLDKKVSITSKKSQTTRSNIYAVKSTKECQIIFIDTPGTHKKTEKTINKILRKKPKEVIHDVDVVLFMVSGTKFDAVDKETLEIVNSSKAKKVLLINKIDLLKSKNELFPFVEKVFLKEEFDSIIPISSKKCEGLDIVQDELEKLMPENDFFYPVEGFDFQSQTFEITEIIREKVIRLLGDELPYQTAVVLDVFQDQHDQINLDATIYVAKESQKKIVIGEEGAKIKSIGTKARIDLEEKYKKKVFLSLWCKVKKNWINDPVTLESFGIKN